MKIAIQGIKGSYHHQVAHELYGVTELEECMSFTALVNAVAGGSVDKAVMAIGNSIAGSILPNYGLIKKNNLAIVGEYYLSIDHQLMGVAGQKIEDIEEVQSHPMALLQCENFLKHHAQIRVVETDDTAAAAYRIAQGNKNGVAAIASSLAADLYGLEILKKNIQEAENNFTRFVILEKSPRSIDSANKATINFTASHKPGSLGWILTDLGNLGINLSKIQSIPVIDKPFLFSFVADLEFEHKYDFDKGLLHLEKLTKSLHVLGVYKSRSL